MVPVDVYPLIAAVGVSLTLMTVSGYRALFQSPEVHVFERTRKDELAEHPETARKAATYGKGVLSRVCGWPTIIPEEWICAPQRKASDAETLQTRT